VTDEQGMPMSEFKIVAESFQSELKKVFEDLLDARMGQDVIKSEIIKHQQGIQQLHLEMKAGFLSVKEQLSQIREVLN
jgi:hypothetical protein